MAVQLSDTVRTRILGSAYTIWMWGGQAIAFCTEVTHRSPQPITQAVDIHPLNYIRPAEIVVPRAITHGEIELGITELYTARVWEVLGGSFGDDQQDLADVLHKQNRAYANPTGAGNYTFVRVVRHPGTNNFTEAFQYLGARIVDIREDETDRADAMQNVMRVTVWYTKKAKIGAPNTTGDDSDTSVGDYIT